MRTRPHNSLWTAIVVLAWFSTVDVRAQQYDYSTYNPLLSNSASSGIAPTAPASGAESPSASGVPIQAANHGDFSPDAYHGGYGTTSSESAAMMNEVRRLPPSNGLTPFETQPAPKYGQNYPPGLLLPETDSGDSADSARKGLPPGMTREGFFQSVTLGGAWLARGSGHNGLGISGSSIRGEFVLPSLIPDSYLTVSPSFGVSRFDNPSTFELPEDVFDAAVGFGIRGRLAPRVSYQGDVSVGSHSDFQSSDGQAARVRGYFSGKWEWNPTVDLLVGVAYTDLEDWPVLPVVGLVLRPNDAQIFNITFPRASYLQRVAATGVFGRRTEYWGLIGIELEGGRWDVEMTDGSFDDLTYRDWRVVLGIEQRTLDAYKLNFEIGYVFARRLEYERSDTSYTPDDTFSMTLTGRF